MIVDDDFEVEASIFGRTGSGRAKKVGYLSKQDSDPRGNIRSIITLAKKCRPFGDVDWHGSVWDVSEAYAARRRGHDQHRLLFNFSAHRDRDSPKQGKGVGPPFDNDNDFTDLIKALICLRYQRRHQGAQSQMTFVRAWRYLYDVLREIKCDVSKATRDHFVTAQAAAKKRESDLSQYGLGRALEEIARTIDQNRLSHYPIDWSGPSGKHRHNRSTEQRRFPSDAALKAVGQLYQVVPKANWADRVRTLQVSLLACTGFRVGEMLTLPARAVEQDVDTGAKYLIYYPEKGPPPQKKWLMTATADLVKDIVDELLILTEEPRRVATWLQENPGRVWLPVEMPEEVSASELARFLGMKLSYATNAGVAFCETRNIPLHGSYPKLCKRLELEAALASERFDQPVVTVLNSGETLRLKDTLAIGFINAFHAQRGTLTYAVRPLTQQMLRVFLTGQESPSGALKSVFQRYGIHDDEGQRIDVSSHGFRHWLNTALDEGGLSDLAQAEWFGRGDPSQNRSYQHSTMATRTAAVRKDLELGNVLGPVADAYRNLAVDRSDAYLAARVRMVHIVPGGMCFHDFSQEPCPNYVQCTDGCGSFHHLKSDQQARKELETQRDALREQIQLAKREISDGTFGAGPWLDLQERKYAQVLEKLGESGEGRSENDASQEKQDPK